MSKEMTGAEMVIEALADQGVKHIFGYPGGAVLPIYDALFQQENVRHILVRHEQGAVHAAEGYARSTGKVGVRAGDLRSRRDQCGHRPHRRADGFDPARLHHRPGADASDRHDAFQECDTVGITRPCTKHNYLVKRIEDLPRVLHEAFYVAANGRPGPVVVDIPKDVQFAKGTYVGPQNIEHKTYQPQVKGDVEKIEAAVELMAQAKRPMFYTGGGVINSGPEASQLLRELVQADRLPDHLDADGARRLSGRRSAMARHARHARHLRSQLGDARLRRDDLHRRALRRPHHRPARCVLAAIRRRSTSISIRPRSTRTSGSISASSAIAAHVLEDMIAAVARGGAAARPEGAEGLVGADRRLARRASRSASSNSNEVIKPQYAIERLYELTKDRDVYITTEVGQHQMWAAQHFHFEEPNRWMTSGGLGTMGYGLPAAVGVQMAHPEALVIDIAGEASVQMTMQEMSTAVQYRLPIKIFILNNEYMGMVRQWQELLHGGRYSHCYSEALPDFVKLAEAYRAVGIRCAKPGELDDAIEEMIDVDKPVIFDCRGRSEGELLPDDPVGRGAQRDDPRRCRGRVSTRRSSDEGKVMV